MSLYIIVRSCIINLVTIENKANMSKKINIVILTGAGISSEAGIKTFRDSGGLWEGHNIEEVATYTGFVRNPRLVYDFYNQRREQLNENLIAPTPAHIALKKLEDHFKDSCVVITQNVDNLHENAGTKNLLHMHGELQKSKCLRSGKVFKCTGELNSDVLCSCCNPGSRMRPDIVWFGETPYHLDEITELLQNADYFISIGTSSEVYPAAMFINMVSESCMSIEVNIEKTGATWRFKDNYLGKASTEIPKLVDKLIKKYS